MREDREVERQADPEVYLAMPGQRVLAIIVCIIAVGLVALFIAVNVWLTAQGWLGKVLG